MATWLLVILGVVGSTTDVRPQQAKPQRAEARRTEQVLPAPQTSPHGAASASGLDTTEKALKIVAYVLGAMWALFHFFMARTYRPRIEPIVTAQLFRRCTPEFLTVGIKVKNVGLGKINLRTAGKAIMVFALDEDEDDDWRQIGVYDVLSKHVAIEPGETIQDAVVVIAEFNNTPLVRVELEFSAGGNAWNATVMTS